MARWTIFLPALLFYPIWITIGFREDMFTSISIYYPMMLAMIVGSMIAGSTPLGGGIVAFPVSVLVLGFSPTEGRDFSLMIQSVGMTAASFLIFYKKKHLLEGCEDLISRFVLMSVIGIIIGFELVGAASPYIVNIVYTTLVTCVVLVFGYRDFINHRLKPVSTNVPIDDNVVETTAVQVLASGSGSEEDASTISLPKRLNTEVGSAFFLEHLLLLVFAIAGGVLSSQIGIGSDTSFYFYGSFLNAIMSRNIGASSSQTMCDNSLTAVSVIVMACTSVVGSILRITTQQASELAVSREVYSALYACSPIVVLGAPLGSLFLTPPNQQRLKYIFYSIGILQLFSFGVIKIGNDLTAWIAIVCVISAVSGSLFMHYMVSGRRLQTDSTVDIETV
mmetsp:Transcript_3040/g.6668  ORF Transcript_3040/g.6668 Transcript_3040/m.6668 type:complete len:392 (+) Transcript_3040:199-1374(+)|eukprot:CAMPEP_0172325404 /NCGR_PEP_ID=MMETSP1058-20130122/53951_1 /TAXON_ID=83371 /ORGANISM="Detonula confervacea, Strain CCMP 353" /LENGTH=391 /DNA_ID=CAMNT_0013041941 /DNA_START=187 /DNA_END=1362 /DNA_ORIENTATION=-